MKDDKSCIIIFAKAPISGHVKTRLAKDLDESVVVSLYRNFVNDIIDKITGSGQVLKIFYDPPGAEPLMSEWLGNRHAFFPQNGTDLGQKMANAFFDVFNTGSKRAVVMGADFPDLPERIITDSLSGLKNHDAVIGPAVDGGYYLIGFSSESYLPAVFNDIPWGTSAVYQKTMDIFAQSGAKVLQLPKWRDIDVYSDLTDLIQSLKLHPQKAQHTYSYLEQTGMIKK